ncbi:hypothetical protein DNTS_004890 [Danionella cerebrum]|uniref:C2 domain-containing protein n=1 Tax=Danionella cerebrum TaxID=2873325 RepID=A0A553MQK8_9TELE|nr:hypothetical protein DNTS_004890 [Danionella translucida]
MAGFSHLRLLSLGVLMLASQLDFASAALRVFDLYAMDLTGDVIGNKPDPYIKVWCGSTFGGTTEHVDSSTNPVWSAEFSFPVCKANEVLKLEVWDKDVFFDDKIGSCTRTLQEGLHKIPCHLSKGTLFYTYELNMWIKVKQTNTFITPTLDPDLTIRIQGKLTLPTAATPYQSSLFVVFAEPKPLYLTKPKFLATWQVKPMGWNHLLFILVKTTMGVFGGLQLLSLATLLLVSQLDFARASVRLFGLNARDLTGDVFPNKPDAYVKVWCGSTFGGQTEHIQGSANPMWTAEFHFPNCKVNEDLKLEVWDKDLNFDDKLGTCTHTVEHGVFSRNCNLPKGTLFFKYELKKRVKERVEELAKIISVPVMGAFCDLRLLALSVLVLVYLLDLSNATVVLYGLRSRNLSGDQYVKIWCGDSFQLVNHLSDGSGPGLSRRYTFPRCLAHQSLRLEVWDRNPGRDFRLGSYSETVRRGSNNRVAFSLRRGRVFLQYDSSSGRHQ